MLVVRLLLNCPAIWLAAALIAPVAWVLPCSETRVAGSIPQTLVGQLKDEANSGLITTPACAEPPAQTDPSSSMRPARAGDFTFMTTPLPGVRGGLPRRANPG